MKKLIFIATATLLLCSVSLPAFSAAITLTPKGGMTWEMLDSHGKLVGTLKRVDESSFSFYDQGGRHVGLILGNGDWVPSVSKRRRISIKPEAAQFYLDVLRAVKGIQ